MEIATGSATNLVSDAVKYVFLQMKRGMSYVFHHKIRVETFENKVETLKQRRDRVQHDVDVAERNVEEIHSDVKNWLMKANEMIDEEANLVKDLEGKANNKCFIGLCPNIKSRYQLSKKAEEDSSLVDELLQQGQFNGVSYRDVPQATVENTAPKDFEVFDSRKQVIDEIMEALEDANINIIGVYGMAGVGKTTLVKEVVRRLRGDKSFDAVVMAAVTQTPDIQKIQNQVAELLGLKLEEKTEAVRAIRLHERLKEKKILVVLDDVWTRLDLKEVGIPYEDENKGCTVLLTSRDLNVLVNGMYAQKTIPMGVLKREEAWDLFKKMAGDSVESPDLVPIATAVSEECDGLPIAISTVARALRNKDLFAWKDALRHLQRPSLSNFKGVPGDAYSAIELSFNHLESEELKQTLLLCSLLGNNSRLKDLLIYAMGLGLYHGVSTVEETRDRMLTVVSNLKASSLLRDSYTNQRFDVHDLICDVSISIASRDNHALILKDKDVLKEWPDRKAMERCNIISLLYASVSELPDELKCPQLTFFLMATRDPSVKIPTNFFNEIKSLQVLDFTKMHFPSLPSSLCLLSSLRALCFFDCVVGDIAIIGELKNLEILVLHGSEIEMIPEKLGQLIKLKMLDLSNCTKLKIIPFGLLSSLCGLEELYMGNSFVQWEAELAAHLSQSQQRNASLAEFNTLSCLTTLDVHIPDAMIIPNDLFLENKLLRYKILIGEVWDWDNKIEESATLKLKLHTGIGSLNYGMKMLLYKAQNVYLDEMTGVEILIHKLEDWRSFRQLKNLHIQNGALIQYIIQDDDISHKIEFPELQSLTLHDLPNLISFCSIHVGSTSIAPQEFPLFNEKIMVPKLEKLKLSSLNIGRIWYNQLSKGSKFLMQNLTSLIIKGCGNLKHILSHSMVKCLQQLEVFEIVECKCIQEIIAIEEKSEDAGRATFSFSRLKILRIEDCPELKAFINKSMINHNTTIGAALFNKKVAFPRLERLTINGMGSWKKIWHDQLAEDSFYSLNYLWVKKCEGLLNVFPLNMVGRLEKLETMVIENCHSLEGIFEAQGPTVANAETSISFVFPKVTYLKLYWLPQLKSFYLRKHTTEWPSLKQMWVYGCDNLEIFASKSLSLGESANQQPLFWVNEATFPNLEELRLEWNDIMKEIWHGQLQPQFFCKLKVLELIKFIVKSDVLPQCFFQSLSNLEKLVVNDAPFSHIFECREEGYGSAMSQLCELRLSKLPELTHIWKEDCKSSLAFCNLRTIVVEQCGKLKNIVPSSMLFANLTTLQVSHCHGFMNLMSCSIANSLLQLTKMIVTNCKMIEEIIACEGGEQKGGIVFNRLKFLQLSCLLSLKGFCLGDHVIKFPALEKLIVNGCPRMEIFCRADLSTPKLKQVQLTEDEDGKNYRQWEGNLTIQQMFDKMVGYGGLKHLKFSEIPELVGIWNRNPKEIVEFKNLEFLEVCDSNNLKCIFNLSMASSLGQLQQLEIKRCKNLEATIMEEEATKTTDDKSIKFPLLKSIIIEACPDLRSFYWGSDLSLIEFPSLTTIQLSHCPNLTTFVFTSSREEDEQAITGEGTFERNVNDLASFFCYKVAVPALENMTISNLRIKRIWCNKLLSDAFCCLKELKVKYCDELLNIVPSNLLGVFQSLEILRVTECGSLEEVFEFQAQGLDVKDTCAVAMQLRILNLSGLPKLKQVWNKDPHGNISFGNLRDVYVYECWSLKSLFQFSIAKGLLRLESLDIQDCGVEEIISRNEEGPEEEIRFELNHLSFLKLWNVPNLKCFYPAIHTTMCPVLKRLSSFASGNIKIFGHEHQFQIQQPLFLIEKVIPQLEEVSLSSDDISTICDCDGKYAGDLFSHIKFLHLFCYHNESATLPFHFLQWFYNLERLEVGCCAFKDLSSYKRDVGEDIDVLALPKIKKLKLDNLPKIIHLWSEDSPLGHICANLETLQVWNCGSLISLGSSSASFQNLTTLDVWQCKGIAELVTSSKAQSLWNLVTMRIRECEMIKEVVSREEDDEATYEITFRELKSLELHCLQSLRSFCSGNYAFNFPSLEQVIVSQCPSLKSFSQGVLSTPKLQRVQLRNTDSTGHWAGDLSATIEQIAQLSE